MAKIEEVDPTDQNPQVTAPPRSLLSYGWVPVVIALGVYYLLLPTLDLDFFGSHNARVASRIIFDPETLIPDVVKRDSVVSAFRSAWAAYERDAFGDDEYHPVSQKGSNLTDAGGVGYMIIDSIDTMMIMGLSDEYTRARDWIASDLSFDRDGRHNTFETIIRLLGGLLSAYHLSSTMSPSSVPDSVFLDKAIDLADRLLPAFQTPSGLPLSMINLAKREGISDADNRGLCSTAEVATLQLEFRYLSQLTDEDIYWKTSEKVMEVIRTAAKGALVPVFISPESGQFVASDIRLGSRGDSYYEYLLKQYLQTSRSETVYRDMYDDAMASVHDVLVRVTPLNKLVFTAELQPSRGAGGRPEDVEWRLIPKQDHLVCFLGGSLLLGATDGGNTLDRAQFTAADARDWKLGQDLIKTCMETHKTATGLAPEIAMFRTPTDPEWVTRDAPADWYIKGLKDAELPLDARYILRPETVESLFIAYRLTGDNKYREWGWQIFQAIEKHCKVATGGYSGIRNVDAPPEQVQLDDRMETFMMGETLKYLYLLFSGGDVLPLTDVVFNTEAHPLPVFVPEFPTGFS